MRKLLFYALLCVMTVATITSCGKDDEDSIVGSSWVAEWSEDFDDEIYYTTQTLTFGSTLCTFTYVESLYSNGHFVSTSTQSHTRICSYEDYPTILLIDGNGDFSTIVISGDSFTWGNQTYYKQ